MAAAPVVPEDEAARQGPRPGYAALDGERRFQVSLEHTSSAVALFGADGTILHASEATRQLLGRDPASMVGMSAFALIHADDHEFCRARLEACVARPATQVDVFARVLHADGTWRDLEGVFTNLLHDDSVRAIVTNYRDRSERRRLEDELQASRRLEAIGRLAGGVAHDFNNILTAILGHIELMRRRSGDDPRLAFSIDEIESETRRAAVLTQQLLAVGRRQTLRPERIDLNAQLASMAAMIRSALGSQAELILRPAAGLPAARVDPAQLDGITLQLALYAREAMPDGGTLTVETGERVVTEPDGGLPAGRWIRMTFADTGPGLSPECQARLFEPFFNAPGGEPSGFGLAAVLGAVRQGGGHLIVESMTGVGTSFHVFLPVAAPPAAAGEPSAASGSRPRRGVREHPRVLVVDDEPTVRRVVARVLGREGYHVVEAESVGSALTQLRGGDELDLVLSDLRLPDGDGLELAQATTKLLPATRFLLMTGYTATAELDETSPRLLRKPFTPRELLEAVSGALT